VIRRGVWGVIRFAWIADRPSRVSRVAAKRFTVELERVQKTATMFRVPFDLKEAFGRARPPVKVTIRGSDDPEAERAFAKLSYTHRREYVEWIAEAKRPETRARRVASAVQRARTGRPPR
jgi:uncharacterized protein YdeI (YjbR/CyaY-like superfamily)